MPTPLLPFRRAFRIPLLLGIALLFAGCADAPIDLKYEARAALDEARREGAESYAPDLLERADQAYRSGVRTLDLQAARWNPSRDYAAAEALLLAARDRARLAGRLSADRRRDMEARADALIATTGGSIGNVDFILTYLSPRTRVRSDLMRARLLHQEARALRSRGEPAAALDRASKASQQVAMVTETLARIIDRHTASDRAGLYRRWVQETVAASAESGGPAILVDKFRHTVTLLKAGRPVRTYRGDIGLNGAQDKSFSGDKATPEGRYRITEKRGPGRTRWYKALLLNYPNEQDVLEFEAAKRRGAIPRRAKIGGLIEIHGEGGRFQDWTEGCVALRNRDIDDLFDRVSVGTPVTIVGYESEDWLTAPAPPRRPSAVARKSRSARGGQSRGGAPGETIR